MSSIAERKTLLRRQLTAQRKTLSHDIWEVKSKAIRDHFLHSDLYARSYTIHCFVSMNDRFEVDTHELLKKMIRDGKEVIVPVTDFGKGELLHVRLNNFDHLEENKWGVLEPENAQQVKTDRIDLVLVPLLAVDLKGNRLGYGKGFYDRFLTETNAQAFGLVFNDFILEEIPADTFDKRLNGIISENGILAV